MVSQQLFIIIPLLLSAGIALSLAIHIWQHKNPIVFPFSVLMFAVAVWSICYTFEITSVGLPGKIFWGKVKYFGILSIPLIWIFLSFRYAMKDAWLKARRLSLLSIIPVISLILIWTNPFHGLIWSDFSLYYLGQLTLKVSTHGPFFWISMGYCYVLLIIGTWILLRALIFTMEYRPLSIVIVCLGILTPWAGNMLYVFHLTPITYLDLSPIAFSISGLIGSWVFIRTPLLDILPVAHEIIVEQLQDIVIILDRKNRIVKCNNAAKELIGMKIEHVLGRSIKEVFPHWPDEGHIFNALGHHFREMMFTKEGEKKIYDMNMTPLFDSRNQLESSVVVLREITDRMHAEEELRAAYSKLKDTQAQVVQSGKMASIGELASGIAHELNQPLTVIRSNSQLLKRCFENNSFDNDFFLNQLTLIEKNTKRMMNIINHLRTFSRQSDVVPRLINIERSH